MIIPLAFTIGRSSVTLSSTASVLFHEVPMPVTVTATVRVGQYEVGEQQPCLYPMLPRISLMRAIRNFKKIVYRWRGFL